MMSSAGACTARLLTYITVHHVQRAEMPEQFMRHEDPFGLHGVEVAVVVSLDFVRVDVTGFALHYISG